MTANYHTHSRWCHHGTGELEEYILRALEGGLQELAITEHVPLLGDPDPRRMQYDEFPAFNEELDRLVEQYRGKLRIIKGFECEYYPEMLDSYRKFREEYGYRLLILGQHRSSDHVWDNFALTQPGQLARYADDVCAGLRTGMFDFLAHPDVFMAGYKVYDRYAKSAMAQIFALCQELDIPVELNANGQHYKRNYPCPPVWEDARAYRLRCLVNSDAHTVDDLLCPSVEECAALADSLGLCRISTLAIRP